MVSVRVIDATSAKLHAIAWLKKSSPPSSGSLPSITQSNSVITYPSKTDTGKLTTPFFEAYGVKPDYRKLLPLFSTVYVKKCESLQGNTLDSQRIKTILVGNDTKLDGRLFYNPATKKLMGSSDYCLNTSLPSGPPCDLVYNGGFNFNLFDNTLKSTPPAFDLGQIVFLPPDHPTDPSQRTTILPIPMTLGTPFSIQCQTSNDIVDVMESEIMPYNPELLTDTTNLVLSLP